LIFKGCNKGEVKHLKAILWCPMCGKEEYFEVDLHEDQYLDTFLKCSECRNQRATEARLIVDLVEVA
jgi:transcription elongation factor Elf1